MGRDTERVGGGVAVLDQVSGGTFAAGALMDGPVGLRSLVGGLLENVVELALGGHEG